jgi:hypothetical protein
MNKKQDMEVLDAVDGGNDEAEPDVDDDGDAIGDLPSAAEKLGGLNLRKASVGGPSTAGNSRKMSSAISRHGSVSSTRSSERGFGVAESAENLRMANKKARVLLVLYFVIDKAPGIKPPCCVVQLSMLQADVERLTKSNATMKTNVRMRAPL